MGRRFVEEEEQRGRRWSRMRETKDEAEFGGKNVTGRERESETWLDVGQRRGKKATSTWNLLAHSPPP